MFAAPEYPEHVYYLTGEKVAWDDYLRLRPAAAVVTPREAARVWCLTLASAILGSGRDHETAASLWPADPRPGGDDIRRALVDASRIYHLTGAPYAQLILRAHKAAAFLAPGRLYNPLSFTDYGDDPLLEALERTGSVRKAAEEAGISHTAALKSLRKRPFDAAAALLRPCVSVGGGA